jgi:hypothetical protein
LVDIDDPWASAIHSSMFLDLTPPSNSRHSDDLFDVCHSAGIY